jgi:serine-type D-Ala-D-Ala carboxypeptidase (penicillin-binding protein 5/6)
MAAGTIRFAVIVTIAFIALASMYWLFAPPRELVLGQPLYEVTGEPADVSAAAWLIFDAESGEVIAGKNQETPMPIASVTKLMTAEIAFERMDLATTTRISARAVAEEGKAGRLKVGDRLTLRELLFPLLLESSNDAAAALSEAYAPEAFVAAMNDRARELGMVSASYKDASGLSPENRASADDLRLLLVYLFETRRHLFDMTLLSTYVGTAHEWHNNNPLLGSEGYLGGKHGFTEEANRTFAGVFEERLHSGRTRPLGIVVLGSENLQHDVGILREYAQEHVLYLYKF